MRTQLIVGPVDEPLEFEEVRQHLRQPEATGDAADEELYGFIQRAREAAEHITGYRFLTQTWDVYFDSFDSVIDLPFPPLQSVTHLKYDSSGTLQTVDAATYAVNGIGERGWINIGYGQSWPTPLVTRDAVVVRLVSGWQDPEFIPASIKGWMLLMIEWQDKNRGLTLDREAFKNNFADRLLDRTRRHVMA